MGLAARTFPLGASWSCASDSEHGKHTGLVAADFLVRALGLVSLGHNGGDVAAGGAVAVGCGHGGHGAGLGCGCGCGCGGFGLAMAMVMVLRVRLRLRLTAGLELSMGG